MKTTKFFFCSPNALPVHKGEVILRSQIRATTIDKDPTDMDRETYVYAIPTALVYGLTPNERFLGRFPRDQRGSNAESRFFACYTFYKNDGVPLKINRTSVFEGLELPTGDEDFSSKSTDLFAGLVWIWQDNRLLPSMF